jgi:hypothetical protein
MRKAINCFARPVLGLPTRRALASSESLDSGISLKSISRSEICLAFFGRRLARADDADCFFAIVCLSWRVNDQYHPKHCRLTQATISAFVAGMALVNPIKAV